MTGPSRSGAKPWFSIFNLMPYSGQEPPFFSDEEMPWRATLESATDEVWHELRAYLKDQSPKSYFARSIASTSGGWLTIPLMTWGLRYPRLACFPRTMAAVETIPGVVSVSFNLLQAGAHIPPHYGDTNATMRVHLGLSIPNGLPDAGMQVHDTQRGWSNGRVVAFCDGYVHRAWNDTKEDRWIMLLDVVRPEYQSSQRMICATVLSSLVLQLAIQKARFLKPALLFPLVASARFGSVCAWALTPVFNYCAARFRRND